ncbi:hypothetical protein [Cellulomonas palmilytica]|uniref:hypothetical protein n=1 Tax=Cellulomonas palmilytica TaxID=2608402 RepID=UPI001F2E779E|nr:hypothetical protein [Cellulomonas palmilytica]UJP39350.1 hypothetical protein F1D97_13545 [Cellulomonas palmilytica]
MTRFTITRQDARGLLLATAPHAGRETDDTPLLGRVRFVPTGDAVFAWCTDYATAVVAHAAVEHEDGDLEPFDLPVGEVRAALAVFTPPSGEARMHWCDELLRIEVTREHVVLTELGHFLDGRQLRVQRIVPANVADKYPDVPRLLLDALEGVPSHGDAYRVKAKYVARFNAVAAWYNDASLRLHGVDDPATVLVRLGATVLGTVPAWLLRDDARDAERTDLATWRTGLGPLRRPTDVDVPESVVDDLRETARALRAAGVTDITVIPAQNAGDHDA